VADWSREILVQVGFREVDAPENSEGMEGGFPALPSPQWRSRAKPRSKSQVADIELADFQVAEVDSIEVVVNFFKTNVFTPERHSFPPKTDVHWKREINMTADVPRTGLSRVDKC
jgi:hypothetical protein